MPVEKAFELALAYTGRDWWDRLNERWRAEDAAAATAEASRHVNAASKK